MRVSRPSIIILHDKGCPTTLYRHGLLSPVECSSGTIFFRYLWLIKVFSWSPRPPYQADSEMPWPRHPGQRQQTTLSRADGLRHAHKAEVSFVAHSGVYSHGIRIQYVVGTPQCWMIWTSLGPGSWPRPLWWDCDSYEGHCVRMFYRLENLPNTRSIIVRLWFVAPESHAHRSHAVLACYRILNNPAHVNYLVSRRFRRTVHLPMCYVVTYGNAANTHLLPSQVVEVNKNIEFVLIYHLVCLPLPGPPPASIPIRHCCPDVTR